MAFTSTEPLTLEVTDGFAVITINQPKKKNALDIVGYKALASLVEAVDARDDVFVTVLTGRGDFFSAGADVKAVRESASSDSVRTDTLARFAANNMNLARALYTHRKILVAALNGPAIGLSAAIIGWCDFVYAAENAYLLTPFSTLAIVAEGGASLSFPRRMGIAMANEALIMGKKLGAAELRANGFVNKIYPQSSDTVFITSVLTHLRERFADLKCLITKKLIKSSLPDPDPANLREVFAGAERFASGRPQEEFAKMAAKTKRHKL